MRVMTFHEQLWITVVDKAVIGTFVVLTGYLLGRALERFKSESALASEFAKQGIAKIAELWESLYGWEDEVRYHGLVVGKQIALAANQEEFSLSIEPAVPRTIELIDKRAKEVKKIIECSRFWLDDDLYDRFTRQYGIVHGYLALLNESPRDTDHEKFAQNLEVSHQSILDYFKDLRTSQHLFDDIARSKFKPPRSNITIYAPNNGGDPRPRHQGVMSMVGDADMQSDLGKGTRWMEGSEQYQRPRTRGPGPASLFPATVRWIVPSTRGAVLGRAPGGFPLHLLVEALFRPEYRQLGRGHHV
jgi:hypothetical protein